MVDNIILVERNEAVKRPGLERVKVVAAGNERPVDDRDRPPD